MQLELVALIAAGTAGLGSLVTAWVNARRNKRLVPAEVEGIEARTQLNLIEAAGKLIADYQEDLEGYRLRETNLTERLSVAEDRLSKVEESLREWKTLAELREHELEQSRMHMAKQDEKIAAQDARIGTLEAEVRRLGGDPDDVPRKTGTH